MSKQFMAILAAVVVGLGLIFFISGNNKNDSGGTSSDTGQVTSHVQGQGKTGVTLLEYGDFQCPVCQAYYPVVKQVAEKYDEQIFFQFRNLPLPQIHPNAFAAARAAEAAGLQKKYFEMHSMLYEQQSAWSSSSNVLPIFQSYAKQLGLNEATFTADYSSNKVNDAINADIKAFGETGQKQATPTFFIDGKYVPNSDLADNNGPSVEKFSQVIDAAIAAKNKQ